MTISRIVVSTEFLTKDFCHTLRPRTMPRQRDPRPAVAMLHEARSNEVCSFRVPT